MGIAALRILIGSRHGACLLICRGACLDARNLGFWVPGFLSKNTICGRGIAESSRENPCLGWVGGMVDSKGRERILWKGIMLDLFLVFPFYEKVSLVILPWFLRG